MPGPWTGTVEITLVDGVSGLFSGPPNSVQAIIGTSTSGTVGQVVATRSLDTLASTFGNGPLPEAAGLVVNAGGTVLAVRATTATAGIVRGSAQATTAISNVAIVATNARITYAAQTPRALQTGDVVTIASVGGATEVNGTWVITVIDATHFEVPVTAITAYTSGGTVEWAAAVTGGGSSGAVGAFAGTAAPYFTGTPNDSYYVRVVAQTGFTVGTTGGSILVSLDAGRNYGPPIPVGTATTIALADTGGKDTGLTINLGASGKTWVGGGVSSGVPVGDYAQCSTIEPLANAAGVQAAIGALSTYLAGSNAAFPIVQTTGIWAGSDATAIASGGSSNLGTLANEHMYVRAIQPARDASPPLAWGGTGETESTWSASVIADFASITTPRVAATGGHYNMPSPFPLSIAGASAYRRPYSFALGARQVAIEPQTHAGRVGGALGGALAQIVVSPRDKSDGFIYHNEARNPVFDGYLPGGVGRIASARTHDRKPGVFAANPLTLAATGSSFGLLPRAVVMDLACASAYDALIEFQYADLTTKANGTLSDAAADTIKAAVVLNMSQGLLAKNAISAFAVVVDQTQQISVTNTLVVTITIVGKGYVLEEQVSIGYSGSLSQG